MIKLSSFKTTAALALLFTVSSASAADIARGASTAKNVSKNMQVSQTANPASLGKGFVASVISNGRGTSNLELEKNKTAKGNENQSTQSTLILCGGQLIEGPCFGGGFLPGRFVPPTVTTTTP